MYLWTFQVKNARLPAYESLTFGQSPKKHIANNIAYMIITLLRLMRYMFASYIR